jgi:hypothetical protein
VTITYPRGETKVANTTSTEWLRLDQLLELLPISDRTAHKLVDEGRIGTLEIPGARKLYSRSDAERVLAESHKPARSLKESRHESGVAVGR